MFSRSVVSDSLQPHGLQHTRLPWCPLPSPRTCSNSRPWSQWCHPAISSSFVPFSSCPQCLPASESSVSQLFAWGDQSTGISALASFFPKKSQGWFPSDSSMMLNIKIFYFIPFPIGLKLMCVESVMPSNQLILCHLLLLLPSVFPSIKAFSSESALHIRGPKCWSFSISPSSEYWGLTSFKVDWFILLAVQGTLKSLSSITNWMH